MSFTQSGQAERDAGRDYDLRKLKALIMDDEAPAREDLRFILENTHLVDVVGECGSGLEVLDMLQQGIHPDLIFLDIQAPGLGGIETAETIRRMENPAKIVFATGFSQFAVQAFDLAAFDYIVKPYDDERIGQTIRRAWLDLRREEEGEKGAPDPVKKLAIYVSDKVLMLDPSAEIIFVKTEKSNSALFYTTKGVLPSKISLKEVEQLLGREFFCRTHKSYIVNLNKIKEMIPWFNDTFLLVMDSYADEQIPVSRHYLPELKKKLHII